MEINKKKKIKIGLDLLMLAALVLFFNTRATGMWYHEIGGLVFFVAVIFHLLLNRNWIKKVTQNLTGKNVTTRIRVVYLVDALLLIAFLCIGISGVFISRVVFHLNTGAFFWRVIHYMAAAVALILMGIHVGLHVSFFSSKIPLPMDRHKRETVVIVFTVLVLIVGGYSCVTTNFVSWLTLPFGSGQMAGHQGNEGRENGFGRGNGNGNGSGYQNRFGRQKENVQPPSGGKSSENVPNGNGRGRAMTGQGISPLLVIETFIKYLSIILLFGIITYWIEYGIKNRKQNEEQHSRPNAPVSQ